MNELVNFDFLSCLKPKLLKVTVYTVVTKGKIFLNPIASLTLIRQ